MTHINAKQRLFILIMIDSIIVTCSIFLGDFILTPFYEINSMHKLFITSICLLVCHFLTAYFLIYIIGHGNMRVLMKYYLLFDLFQRLYY